VYRDRRVGQTIKIRRVGANKEALAYLITTAPAACLASH
jgi:hypothetical protein